MLPPPSTRARLPAPVCANAGLLFMSLTALACFNACWEINGGLNSQVLPSLKYDTLTEFLNAYLFEIDASLQIKTNTILALMIKYIVMGLRGFFLLAAKIWSFICYCFKRQARAVSDINNKSPESKTMIYIFHLPR
jgi:hypothetical protein